MSRHLRLAVAALLAFALAGAAEDPRKLLLEHPLEDFGETGYGWAAEAVLAAFESHTATRLAPGARGKVALKVATRPGPGLSTPKPLVRAVAEALRRRGFAEGAVLVCDAESAGLRRSGFLPANPREPARFGDLPVRAWDKEARGWSDDAAWGFANPVPPPPGAGLPEWNDPRTSLLPRPLGEEVDFWIHLPVLTDSPELGVHGAIADASLGNATNTARFAGNPRNAAVAAVSMAAWPALDGRRALTLLSLERYQVRGGPAFDAGWTRSEPRLLASANPLILDHLGWLRIRAARGEAVTAPEPALFQAAAEGGAALGPARPAEVTLVRLGGR